MKRKIAEEIIDELIEQAFITCVCEEKCSRGEDVLEKEKLQKMRENIIKKKWRTTVPLTNKLGLPMPIVKALEKETYDPGHGDFSATGLIAPPKVKELERRHRAEIFEDVSDKLYSLDGQLNHLLLERAGVKCEGYQVEERMYAQYGRWLVSAQYDCLFLDDGVLTDYKRTTCYSVQKNVDGSMELKKEWFAQLNIQADILRKNPDKIKVPINKLQIVAMLRDWQPSKAAQDPLYPQSQIVIVPIPMVTSDRVEAYVLNRCELHQQARDQANEDLIPECSKEDRWEDETKFAVMKGGAKRATKVFESEQEAKLWLSVQRDADAFHLDIRPGFARRCMGVGTKVYCPARNFCHHYRALADRYKAAYSASPEGQP